MATTETDEQRHERLLDAQALMHDLVIEAGYDAKPLTEDEARRVAAAKDDLGEYRAADDHDAMLDAYYEDVSIEDHS